MGRRPEGGQGQNRTGESPPSGSAGGPAETWTKVECGTHLAYRKSECWKLSTYSCARRRSIPTAKGAEEKTKGKLPREIVESLQQRAASPGRGMTMPGPGG